MYRRGRGPKSGSNLLTSFVDLHIAFFEAEYGFNGKYTYKTLRTTRVVSLALAEVVSFNPLNLATWQNLIFIERLRPYGKHPKHDFLK